MNQAEIDLQQLAVGMYERLPPRPARTTLRTPVRVVKWLRRARQHIVRVRNRVLYAVMFNDMRRMLSVHDRPGRPRYVKRDSYTPGWLRPPGAYRLGL